MAIALSCALSIHKNFHRKKNNYDYEGKKLEENVLKSTVLIYFQQVHHLVQYLETLQDGYQDLGVVDLMMNGHFHPAWLIHVTIVIYYKLVNVGFCY